MKDKANINHQIKTQILELTDLELSNMKTMLRILIEKVDKHSRTDE